MAIDTSTFESGTPTLYGGIRNSIQFWPEWSQTYPDTLSEANLARIQAGRSPIVDAQWLETFPEQSNYEGDVLVHHHLDYGANAIPLPETLHAEQPGWGVWRPEHAGGQ